MFVKLMKIIVPLCFVGVAFITPPPEGLSVNAWHFLGVFTGVIVGLIVEPIPGALIGFIGIVLTAALGLVGDTPKANIQWALSGFANPVIWLIFAACMFALGYTKTGLGKRISLIIIKYMGRHSIGLGYAVAFSDLVLAPFMPSNTARSAGTIYPVVINIPQLFGSTPENEPRKIGAYITWVGIASVCVSSSMFLTALAPNLLAVDLLAQQTGISISWGAWAKIMLPITIPLFLLVPILTYLIYPPTQKRFPEAPKWAAQELEKLPPFSAKEMLMTLTAVGALVAWIFGKQWGINSSTAAMAAVCIMVLIKILSWDDILSNKSAFNILIWFSTLVALASGLAKVGILEWVGKNVEVLLGGMTPSMLMITMLVLFFVIHYFFASGTAHVVALVPVFSAIAVRLIPEAQLLTFMILLAGSLGLQGILTPYGTGPSPTWYNSHYIPAPHWWGLGLVFGAIYLGVFLLGAVFFL